MPAAFCQLHLRWDVCGGTTLLVLQPPVTLWQIYSVMIKKGRFCQLDGLELINNAPVLYNLSVFLLAWCRIINISSLLCSRLAERLYCHRRMCAYRVLQSNTWQMADSFVERLAGCGILRGSAALLKSCRLNTSIFVIFYSNLEKGYLKESR